MLAKITLKDSVDIYFNSLVCLCSADAAWELLCRRGGSFSIFYPLFLVPNYSSQFHFAAFRVIPNSDYVF